MKHLSLSLPVIMLLSLASCSHSSEEMEEEFFLPDPSPDVTDGFVLVEVPDFQFESATRTDINVASGIATSVWAENDALGIFPQTTPDSQIKFRLQAGLGAHKASFDGGNWMLRAEREYIAYFPYHPRGAAYTYHGLPAVYSGQEQQGNASTAHLGAFDYMGSAPQQVDAERKVCFSMHHVGCVVRFRLSVPADEEFRSLQITSSREPFVIEGAYDISGDVPSLTSVCSESSISLALHDVTSSKSSKTIDCYMMLAPADYSASSFQLLLSGAKADYRYTISGCRLLAGHAYGFVAKDYTTL